MTHQPDPAQSAATLDVLTRIADALGDGEIVFAFADASGAFDHGDGTWGVEAYFPEALDEADLAATLAEVVADPERARAYGAAGRERAATAFSWQAIADATESLYREVAQPSR